MPYIVTSTSTVCGEYKGYTYELPANEYKWIPDPTWYDTKATPAERMMINLYVELIYITVKYVHDKEDRKLIIMKMLSTFELPSPEFKQHILHRFYKIN